MKRIKKKCATKSAKKRNKGETVKEAIIRLEFELHGPTPNKAYWKVGV